MRTTKEEVVSWIVQDLQKAKTEEDLEKVNDLAEDAVTAGLLTREEADTLWDDFAPTLEP